MTHEHRREVVQLQVQLRRSQLCIRVCAYRVFELAVAFSQQ